MARRGIYKDFPNRGEQVSDTCPNCRNRTSLTLEDQWRVWPTLNNVDPQGLPEETRASLTEHVWRCDYCRRTSLVRKVYATNGGIVRDPVEVRLAWPKRAPRELPDAAPDEVRSLYREASIAEYAGALRGAAALYRAAVEELVGARQARGRNLREQIDALADQGVDADIVRDLHEARLTANWSLHQGTQFSAEEVADVAGLINDAVEILWVEPARRAAMREAREARRTGQTTQPQENGPGGEPNA
jgi:hypothetical protein